MKQGWILAGAVAIVILAVAGGGMFYFYGTEEGMDALTADTPEVSQAMETELQRMINGEQSPEEAVQAAAETVAENTDRDLA